ncbi:MULTISPECIES: Asp-tRNA(Asn)/Glu-tRNA(Gln) amidotransferase subunit GatC [Archaeoglobus]|jgi:aspartyl-tRNA(Asn)/glutamyl-tRNA(Gln) amidotransferase subunit C|uniref:Glutamyl-tRNA(Gln) amidotransferase subunit C n=3 Tax=Archaeoglobus fulgidus TaxID=2234 RepID=GATC_ARCFU|nr:MULTISPECIES: Asp-tRNA(Asn)/Glu-tRNA(Gln) amidotransferase subunit GatC [Archaeoglobus]O27956.1 RecName: Full=Glutamyl-tRNA(Gln) amidotransferase subunit C; Short=Glu-ADT subunit C [Archaeoglobus fulgidus DSM 4304]AAB88922.1 Glu-tRNA amidotransferase, subunit C (gatC) [Archaeoglobus fulgidus DSM 4304]AIG99338.1 aspartyl/glutamyl-tRNA(Asn/Gln) amidotransferase, C subunit [Archaeoglobus fulgidus DSM 8774]KUJ94711.1 MAG: Glutamyl-tRNA(Gln) amidotransferase subunit C [Archaeoglobus fulgidus]KUK
MVSIEDVYHTAELAKIEITEEQAEKFRKEFETILDYFNILDEVEEDVEPTFHVLPLTNVFREDEPGECLKQEEALSNAKHKEEGYFKGPRVVE